MYICILFPRLLYQALLEAFPEFICPLPQLLLPTILIALSAHSHHNTYHSGFRLCYLSDRSITPSCLKAETVQIQSAKHIYIMEDYLVAFVLGTPDEQSPALERELHLIAIKSAVERQVQVVDLWAS